LLVTCGNQGSCTTESSINYRYRELKIDCLQNCCSHNPHYIL